MNNSNHPQEDLTQKLLWESSSRPDNIHVSPEGCIAVMTNSSVHIFTPSLQYMSCYVVHYLLIQSTIAETSSMPPPNFVTNDPSFTDLTSKTLDRTMYQWLEDNNKSLGANQEVSYCIAQIAWVKNLAMDGTGSWLMVLINNGQLFLCQRRPLSQSLVSLSVPISSSYCLKLCGYEVVWKNDSICSMSSLLPVVGFGATSMPPSAPSHQMDFGNYSFIVLADAASLHLVLLYDSISNNLPNCSAWRVKASLLLRYDVPPAMTAKEKDQGDLQFVTLHHAGGLASYSSTPPKQVVHIIAATHLGSIFVVTVALPYGLEELVEATRNIDEEDASCILQVRNVSTTSGLAPRLSYCAVELVKLINNFAVIVTTVEVIILRFAAGTLSNTTTSSSSSSDSNEFFYLFRFTKPQHWLNVMGCTFLNGCPIILENGNKHFDICFVTSIGMMQTGRITLSQDDTFKGFEVVHQLSITSGPSCYGVSVDCSRQLCIVTYQKPGSISNSREVQINSLLSRPQTIIRWMINPTSAFTLVDNTMLVNKLEELLCQLSNINQTSLSHLLIACTLSLTENKAKLRKLPKKPLPKAIKIAQHGSQEEKDEYCESITIKKEQETPKVGTVEEFIDVDQVKKEMDKGDNDEFKNEEETIDTSDSEEIRQSRKKVKTSSTKSKGNEGMKSSSDLVENDDGDIAEGGIKDTESKFGLQAIYSSVVDYLDPNEVQQSLYGLSRILDAAVILSIRFQTQLSSSMLLNNVETLSFEEKGSLLQAWPESLEELRKKLLVWKIWVMITQGLIQLRRIKLSEGDLALLQLMMVVKQRISGTECLLHAHDVWLQSEREEFNAIDIAVKKDFFRICCYYIMVIEQYLPKNLSSDILTAIYGILIKQEELVNHGASRVCMSSGWLMSVVGEEECVVCSSLLSFDASSFQTSFCPTCEISYERCCRTFHLLTTLPAHLKKRQVDATRWSMSLYQCPLCQAVVNSNFLGLLKGKNDSVIGMPWINCLYCAISMLPLDG